MLFDHYLKKAINKKRSPGRDSKFKSVSKAISWRILGTFDTILISYLITGELKMAFSIGSVEVFSKIGLYYIHERIWDRYTTKKQADAIERSTTVTA